MAVAILLLVVSLFYLLYLVAKYNSKYWDRRGILTPPVTNVFKNHMDAFTTRDYPGNFKIAEWTKEYGKVYGLMNGSLKYLVFSDPEMVNEFMVKQFENFHGRNSSLIAGNVDKNNRAHVFIARGARWKRLRTISAPSFNVNNLKRIIPTVDDSCRVMLTYLDNASAKDTPFNILPYFHELTMDIICRVAMGQRGTRQFENPDVEIVKNIFAEFGSSSFEKACNMFPAVSEYIRMFALGAHWLRGSPFMRLITQLYKEVEARRALRATGKVKHENGRIDFIDLFLDLENQNIEDEKFVATGLKVEKKMTTDEIVSQCFVFLLAGFDTTANTLTTTAFELAKNPEIQDILIDEIDGVCPDDDDISYEQVNDLRYVDVVMKESLRLHPIASFAVSRECMESTTIGDVKVFKGERVIADVISLHRDPEVWGPNADEFMPDRFFDLTPQQNMAYYPFGGGPRICIGMKLAYVEEKIALVRLLKKYRIVACDQTETRMKLVGCSVFSPESVTVKLVKRD